MCARWFVVVLVVSVALPLVLGSAKTPGKRWRGKGRPGAREQQQGRPRAREHHQGRLRGREQHHRLQERVSFKECNIEPAQRLDCGYNGINEEGCYRRGCCYKTSGDASVPKCYYSTFMIEEQCMINSTERVECGFPGIKKEQCLASGCCYQPKNDYNVPWCYNIRKEPVDWGECGHPAIEPRVDMRIVGGVEAREHSWPWQVSLQYPGFGHFCGGSIINSHWIVTAAHCELDTMTVVAGMHNVNSQDDQFQEVEVELIIPHEDYGHRPMDSDIMLLKVNPPLTLTEGVSPVCLPEQGMPADPGLRCYVTGWGTLESGGSSPDTLQQVKVPVVSNEACNEYDVYNGDITENMVCAGYEEGGRDSCQGDSGGPFVSRLGSTWYLVGVVSWGRGCAYEGYPGVYAKTSNFVDWIHQKIEEN